MEGAIKALWQDCRIKIPFPNWRPNKHDALDLRFAKPSAIRQSLNPIPSKNSDGADVVELEMLLTMPSVGLLGTEQSPLRRIPKCFVGICSSLELSSRSLLPPKSLLLSEHRRWSDRPP